MSQHMVALERANTIRLARAAARRELAALSYREGLGVAAAMIRQPPDGCDGMRVDRLLAAIQFFGPGRVRHALRMAHVPESTSLGELTERQQDALCHQLAVRGRG